MAFLFLLAIAFIVFRFLSKLMEVNSRSQRQTGQVPQNLPQNTRNEPLIGSEAHHNDNGKRVQTYSCAIWTKSDPEISRSNSASARYCHDIKSQSRLQHSSSFEFVEQQLPQRRSRSTTRGRRRAGTPLAAPRSSRSTQGRTRARRGSSTVQIQLGIF